MRAMYEPCIQLAKSFCSPGYNDGGFPLKYVYVELANAN